MNTEAHRNMSAMLIGAGGAGKSQVMHSMGKTFCIRYQHPLYIYTKALDPMGILTRSGTTGMAGFFGFSDFDPNTLMNSTMSSEEVKSLFDCQEGGSHRARYHVATYPRKTPKCFAPNATAEECGEMFEGMALQMFAHLMNKDVAKMLELSTTDQAIARRVVVFPIKDTIISTEHIQELKNADQAAVTEGKEREQEWMQKHRQ